ncbi:hypothetical protein BJ165DRAFT_1408957 [Panaeolus papilionaceus]|nr:hypothetical protein BJ165DRAFT_1408957 [Panaeolus papilionaceus]
MRAHAASSTQYSTYPLAISLLRMVSLGRDTFEFISESDLRGGEEDNQMLEFHNGIAQYQDTSTLRPTLQNVHIRDVWDAKKVFYAVATGVLPLVTRPPYKTERPSIRPGNVYVWRGDQGSAELLTENAFLGKNMDLGIGFTVPLRRVGRGCSPQGLLWHMERDPTLELRPLYDAFEHAPVEAIAEEDLMVRQHYDVVATLPTIDGPSRSRKWILSFGISGVAMGFVGGRTYLRALGVGWRRFGTLLDIGTESRCLCIDLFRNTKAYEEAIILDSSNDSADTAD